MGTVFFIETSKNEKDLLIYHLAEFFYQQKDTVQIITAGVNRSREIDTLLWTFTKESFVPHKIRQSESTESLLDPVVISFSEFNSFTIIIFDISVQASSISANKTSIIFVVKDDADLLNQSREVWKEVKTSGFHVYHIKNPDFESVKNELTRSRGSR
jgi:DNA polymerase III subunit chi